MKNLFLVEVTGTMIRNALGWAFVWAIVIGVFVAEAFCL
jgi:hypothetical protein